MCQPYTFVVAVAGAVAVVVAAPAAVVLVVVEPVVALVAVAPVAVVALVAAAVPVGQQPGQLVSVVAEVCSAAGPCAGVDATTNDFSGRRLCHTYRTRAILCGNCRPCDAVGAGTNHVSARTHDRNQDKCVVLASDPLAVMFALHRAYG